VRGREPGAVFGRVAVDDGLFAFQPWHAQGEPCVLPPEQVSK
jgi:hypothetical protein